MKTIEGRVVRIFNNQEYGFMVVDAGNSYVTREKGRLRVIVTPRQIPPNFENDFKSLRVLVELDENDEALMVENGFAKLHKKTQNLRELFSLFGPSKEIKQRMSNGQLKINNEVIKSFDVEVDIDFEWETHKLVDAPDFLMDSGLDLGQLVGMKAFGVDIFDFFGSPTIKDGPTNIDKFAFLSNHVLVSISKREHYVFPNNEVVDNIPNLLDFKKFPGLIPTSIEPGLNKS
jgi:hypothetical protein